MLDITINNFSHENKSHADLKTETKGDDIRKEIKDNTIRIISSQRKELKGNVEKLKEKVELFTEGD